MQPTPEKPSNQAPSTDLRRTLREDHERLDQLFADLLAAFQADARDDAARFWNEFDHGLRTHMELEERHLFPVFGRVNEPEAAALLREHGRILWHRLASARSAVHLGPASGGERSSA